jgi:hypothetical protein
MGTSLIRLLQEVSVEQLKQQWVDTKKIDQSIFDRIVTACKQKSNWVTWMVKRVADKAINPEDIELWQELIPVFERFKARFQQKDINQIKTPEEIADFRHEITQIQNATQKQVNIQAQHAVERVQAKQDNDGYLGECPTPEEGNYKVYKITKKDGHHLAMKLGAGTSWCTASKNSRWFNSYIKDGPLYVFISEKNPRVKYQIHIPSEQCMDARDSSAFAAPSTIAFYDYLVKHEDIKKLPKTIQTRKRLLLLATNRQDKIGRYLQNSEGVLEFYVLPKEIARPYLGNKNKVQFISKADIVYLVFDTQVKEFISSINLNGENDVEFVNNYTDSKSLTQYTSQEIRSLVRWYGKNKGTAAIDADKGVVSWINKTEKDIEKYLLPEKAGIFTRIYKFKSGEAIRVLDPALGGYGYHVCAVDDVGNVWSFSARFIRIGSKEYGTVRAVPRQALEHADDIIRVYNLTKLAVPFFFQEAINMSQGQAPTLKMPDLIRQLEKTVPEKQIDTTRVRHSTESGWEGTWEQYGKNMLRSSPQYAGEVQEYLVKHPTCRARVAFWLVTDMYSDWNCLIQVFDSKGKKLWDMRRTGYGQGLTWNSRDYVDDIDNVQENLNLARTLDKINSVLYENQQIKQYPVLVGLKGKVVSGLLGNRTETLQETATFGLYKTSLLTQKSPVEGCRALQLELECKLLPKGIKKVVVVPLTREN